MSNIQKLAIQDLVPGMVILRVTQQQGPVKISKSGLVSSMDMVQGLQEMGILQVEVDLDQTVQIESDSVPIVEPSATQKMLTRSMSSNNRLDDSLSSQFHRSLFLPSVNDLPSKFQFYAKRYSRAAVVAVMGLIFGLMLGNLGTINHMFQTVVNNSSATLGQNSAEDLDTVSIETGSIDTEQTESDNLQNQSPLLSPNETHKGTQNTNQATSKGNDLITDGAQTEQDLVQHNTRPIASAPTLAASAVAQNVPRQNDQNLAVQSQDDNLNQNQRPQAESAQAPVEPAPVQISNELLSKFNKALQEVSEQPESEIAPEKSDVQGVVRIDQLPPWLMTELPSMAFSAHMYASDPKQRWVRVNNDKLVEGDLIDRKVTIMRIDPQHVILNYAGHEFSMSALTDW